LALRHSIETQSQKERIQIPEFFASAATNASLLEGSIAQLLRCRSCRWQLSVATTCNVCWYSLQPSLVYSNAHIFKLDIVAVVWTTKRVERRVC